MHITRHVASLTTLRKMSFFVLLVLLARLSSGQTTMTSILLGSDENQVLDAASFLTVNTAILNRRIPAETGILQRKTICYLKHLMVKKT